MFVAMHSSLVEGRGSNRLVRISHGQCPTLPLFVHLSPDSRLFLPGSHPVLMKGTQNTSQSFGCATLRHFLCFETLACLFCQLMWHMCTHATWHFMTYDITNVKGFTISLEWACLLAQVQSFVCSKCFLRSLGRLWMKSNDSLGSWFYISLCFPPS